MVKLAWGGWFANKPTVNLGTEETIEAKLEPPPQAFSSPVSIQKDSFGKISRVNSESIFHSNDLGPKIAHQVLVKKHEQHSFIKIHELFGVYVYARLTTKPHEFILVKYG